MYYFNVEFICVCVFISATIVPSIQNALPTISGRTTSDSQSANTNTGNAEQNVTLNDKETAKSKF